MTAPNAREAFSYRRDGDVPNFDDTRPLVIFDGHCVLCSSGVQWMLKRDPEGSTKFAAVQQPVARALYRHYGLDPDTFDTFMVLKDGRPYLRWAGVVAAGRTLPGAWYALSLIAVLLPAIIGDRIYDFVQRNRLSWFGSREQCFIAEPDARNRFL
jgi:predicted DCC family thiol-disulfide oxidoreductase YuxK